MAKYSVAKAQLKAYYKAQGLDKEARKEAVAADYALVKKNATNVDDDSLVCLFYWTATEQGNKYWSDRNAF